MFSHDRRNACLKKWQPILNRMAIQNGTIEIGTLESFYLEMKNAEYKDWHTKQEGK